MKPRACIDLNADVGEGYDDGPVLRYVSSVNIACGAHAGDEPTMQRTLELARTLKLAVGAHPGYADRAHFGRRALELPAAEVTTLVQTQVDKLWRMAQALGMTLTHVKAHGALYNQAAVDPALARAVARGVAAVSHHLRLVGLAESCQLSAAQALGLPTAGEAFVDRRYRSDGTLVPRGLPGAMLEQVEDAAAQALALALGQPIRSIEGTPLCVHAQTLCLHGDGPRAGQLAAAVAQALRSAGVEIRTFGPRPAHLP